MKSKKTKKNTVKDNYLEIFDFISESKNYIFLALGVFIFFSLVGYFVKPTPEIVESVMKILQEIILKFENKGAIETIWLIFSNNLGASFIVLIGGVLFGIFPILMLISNGYILGFVAKLSVGEAGILVLWRLLPHGIFEIPAVLISAGFGIKIGFELFKKDHFKNNLKSSLKTFFLVIIPLLIIAAIIEGLLVFFIK